MQKIKGMAQNIFVHFSSQHSQEISYTEAGKQKGNQILLLQVYNQH